MIDESGNSLLHLCVMHKRKNQFTHLITRHKELAKFLKAPNADGFTPLLLAALTRDYEMFEQVEKVLLLPRSPKMTLSRSICC